jgi:hypothetical protein
MSAPVTSVTISWNKVYLVYATWSVYMEMGVTIFGPISNTLIFLFLMLVCHLSNKWIHCFPVYFCKIIAWYGLLTVMDFVFICVVDLAFMDYSGDLFKLYNYYQKSDSSGAIGMFITFII